VPQKYTGLGYTCTISRRMKTFIKIPKTGVMRI